MMKKLTFLVLLFLQSLMLYATTADELMAMHKVTTTEMNNITTPQAGSLVYNTTENTLFFYTGTVWKRVRSIGSETIIQAEDNIDIFGNGSSATPYMIGGQ